MKIFVSKDFFDLKSKIITDKNIADLSQFSVLKLKDFFENIKLDKKDQMIAEKIVQQIEALEMQIAQAQKVIDAAPQQKQAILQKYL